MLIQKAGVMFHDPSRSTPGYTLFSRTQSSDVYLVDLDGRVVRQWETGGGSTHFSCLLANGNLWVCERVEDAPPIMAGPGGRMREYDWESNVV